LAAVVLTETGDAHSQPPQGVLGGVPTAVKLEQTAVERSRGASLTLLVGSGNRHARRLAFAAAGAL
jgi:hypothetical protein